MRTGTIAIFGQYKSGTTGLFYKIKNSLAGPVRTLFEPREYVPEPGDAGRSVLAKVILGLAGDEEAAHYETFLGFDKKLYLIRDPRDWLVSGTLFLVQEIDAKERVDRIVALLRKKEADPKAISLLEIFDYVLKSRPDRSLEQTTAWMKRQAEWLFEFESRLGDHHRIKYEDFVDGRLDALERYLGFPLVGSAKVDEEHDHVPRTERYGDWKNWLTPSDVAYFRPVFDAYIRRYGYSSDWAVNEDPVVRPEFASEYVERLARKRGAGTR